LFTEAGFTVTETLEAATRLGAEILDMDHLIGTLEEGKLADILVVRGRPDENLDDLLNVNLVLRDGYLIVQDGRVFIPRHEAWPLPLPSAKPKGPWG
jgi:imidazolonepropionase-like amidohydrolase